MISLDVQLQLSRRSQRPATAVLLPGEDPVAWLRWLSVEGVALESVRLLPVATGTSGLLGVICPVTEEVATRIEWRFARYGCVGRRLYVPIEAAFDPPMADADWRELLPADDSLLVWHPQLGLIRFEAEQQLRVADLCGPPERREVDWGRAEPGTAFNQRLHSMQGVAPPDVTAMIQQGQDDIGTQADQRSRLPRSPSEPSLWNWKTAALLPLLPFIMLAEWLAQRIPKSVTGSHFMAGVDKLLSRIAALTPKIMQEREREIQRLLDKLRDDPDEGLKYALPMSDVQGRGVANPTSRLTSRNVDFRLGSSGGGPTDSWAIDAALQAQLMASYRENAAREIRLERFRRAAYIYASLLGDHQAAANALEQGRFFHEAAAVYRDKLKRPADAARCFERGGLLQDAIEIYADLKQHIKVGELYERLEQPDEARAAFQLAVDERLLQNDRLGAADLLQQRLKDDEAAMTVLEEGWPSSSQATHCLERYFAMTSSRGEQSKALAKIEVLRQQTLPPRQQIDLISSLSRVARTHADQIAVERAADATRVLAAGVLERASTALPRVLQAIADLAPEDLLLGRDTRRFGQSDPPPAVTTTRRREESPRRVTGRLDRTITLPAGYHWLHGESVGKHYFLVGHDGQHTLMLLRGYLEGDGKTQVSATWNGRGSADQDEPILLHFETQGQPIVRIGQAYCPPFPPRLLPATDDFPQPITAETPGWLPPDAVALASNLVTIHTCGAEGEVNQFDRNGLKIATLQLVHPDPDSEQIIGLTPRHVMHARPRDTYIGFGSTLFRISESGQQQALQFPSPITGISGTRPHTRERLLVTHETGAFLLSPTVEQFGESMIEEQTEGLRGCIMDDHRAVLWRPAAGGAGDLLLYSFDQNRVVFQGRSARSAIAPQEVDQEDSGVLTLLPTTLHHQVAIIPQGPDAPIELWSFPSQ